MEIITEYSPNSIKNAGFEATHKNIFRIASPTAKSKLIEFFDDIYTYPPKFNVKWDSIDELHNDLFMSYNYRTLEYSLPFMNILADFFKQEQESKIIGDKYSSNSYIEGYVNKIVSTKFYNKQTKRIQNCLRTIPTYVILNGQGNIILANSTDQLNINTTNLKSSLYNFCGGFDPLAEKSSQLGLFFMSQKDAELYLNEIAKFDPEGTKTLGLSIHCFGLDFAYRVMRDYHPKIDFRLVPDLNEIKKLLTSSNADTIFEDDQQQLRLRKRSLNPLPSFGNFSKHTFPLYSFLEKREYFKGTPIYIVQVSDVRKNFLSQKSLNLVHFFDTFYGRVIKSADFLSGFGNNWIMQGSLIEQKYDNIATTYIFFEKDGALEFANKSKQKIKHYKGSQSNHFKSLIKRPKVLVYNLEDFLELWEETLAKKQATPFITNSNEKELEFFDSQNINLVPTNANKKSMSEFFQQPKKSSIQKFNNFLSYKIRCLTGFTRTILNTN
jgi:hypothetical protein